MDTSGWERVQELFLAALEVAKPDRSRFLAEACRDEPELVDEVQALLAAHVDEGRLDRLADELAPILAEPEKTPTPERIGPYRVVRELGHGGMGTVFLADRADGQFEHRVALKLLRDDVPGGELRRRFLAERQILAHLRHPNIARLFDGGLTENGRPYFVMEYVEGVPIDVWSNERRLGLDERLALFRTTCAAVHYAHRHLVVHRDLKPGNILVSKEGTVKLLDFGIAKLLDADGSGQPIAVTRPGTWLMTPDYASPEQVRGEPITTASDVYQLGILLYELLTGHRPYRLPSHSLAEVSRLVCETPPPRPSTVVDRVESAERGAPSTVEITPETVSHARRTSVERLRRRLKGDLDNIALKALRKEPDRRYGSVEQLSEDVRRYLARLPVAARRDTFWYRASTFARRNRTAVAASAVVLALIVTFAVAMALQAKRTARERDKAQHVASFLVDLFEVSDPSEARGETVTAREILDQGAQRIRAELDAEPEVQATMMDSIGRVYVNLGLLTDAAPLLEEALTLRRQTLGPVHPEVAASLHSLAVLREEKGEFADAESLYQQALDMRRGLFGRSHPEVAESLAALAVMVQNNNDLERAEPLVREALAIRRQIFGEVHPDVATSLNNLAWFLHAKGDSDEAERRYRQAIEIKRTLYGDVHPDIAISMTNLGWLLRTRGDLDSAETLFRDALAMRHELYGETHPYVARSLSALADLLIERGRYEDAEPLAREALATHRELQGDQHPAVADGLRTLAAILQQKGDTEEAKALYREAIALHERSRSARSLNDLASLLEAEGDLAEAESLYRESLAIYRENLGEDHPFVAIVAGNLAAVLQAQGVLQEAETILREALTTLETAWGEDHARTIWMRVRLGRLLLDRDDAPVAEPLLREALAAQRRTRPEEEVAIASIQGVLGRCLAARESYAEAETALSEAYAVLADVPRREEEVRKLLRLLVDLYRTRGETEKADRHQELLARAERSPAPR